MTEGKDNVFGSDPELRREASPLFHIKKDASPLVEYCCRLFLRFFWPRRNRT